MRREYTVIGDTVNLAARLMQRADGRILCDERTRSAAGSAVHFDEPRSLRLKGKAGAVTVHEPTGEPARLDTAVPVIGHAAERAGLEAALQRLQQGESGIVVLEGAAGLGKSQLVGRVVALAAAAGIMAVTGGGDPIEQSTPYFAVRPLFTRLLGLDAPELIGREARSQHLARRRALDPVLDRLAPLLAEVLELDLDDTELTAAMQGEVRAFNIQDLCVHLFAQATAAPDGSPRPVAVIVEDAQWLDSASWALVRQLADGVAPLLLVLACRPMDPPLPPAFEDLAGRARTARIRVEPLTLEDTRALLAERLPAPPSPELVRTIYDRAAGNPFFTGELALALVEGGLVVEVDGQARLGTDGGQGISLPETVQAAILARIDRLEPRQQLMLKVASVIGRSFAYHLLQSVYPVSQDRPLLRTKCDELVALDMTEPEHPDPEPSWLYRQETTREVAYDLLLFSQRRKLHEAVARSLEEHAADKLAPVYARLAWHWDRAGHADKTLFYLERAGDQAVREGAYQEAERAFTRAQALLDEHPELVPEDRVATRRAHWARQRGEALLGLGRLPESRAALERAVALLGFPLPPSLPGVGWRLVTGGSKQLGARLFRRPAAPLSEEQRAVHSEAAGAYLRLIETYFFLAGPAETLNAALQALNIAEAAGPSPELARSYALTGWILSMVPQFALADVYLALAAELVDTPEGRAARQPVRFFTGFTRVASGRWEEGREALEEAMELAEAMGDKRRWIEAVCGISSPLHYQGEYERRIQLGADVLYTSARRQGDFQAEAWGILDQLESLVAVGDLDRIGPLLDDLEPFLQHDIGRSEQVWGHGLLAHGRLLQGRLDAAWAAAVATNTAAAAMAPVAVYVFEGHAGAAEVVLGLAEAGWTGVDAPTLAAEIERACKQLERYARIFPFARARALCSRGRQSALAGKRRAARQLRAAVRAAVELRMPFEEAVAREALARVTHDGDAQARAEAIFAELGAVRRRLEPRT